ncbi:MAG: hypothetical protein II534_00575 [Clostridia bacterium]|nr:hypothetical protein [Clostridia bacterium]
MAEKSIRETIEECAGRTGFCSILNRFEYSYRHILPVMAGEKRFLALQESEFRFDGYIIEDYATVDRAVPADERFSEIARLEGLLDGPEAPPVELSSYRSIFAFLCNAGYNVEIETGTPGGGGISIFTGRVTNCTEHDFRLLRFGIDCRWDNFPVTVWYDDLRVVRFGSKYLEMYSKHLPTCPVNPVRFNF